MQTEYTTLYLRVLPIHAQKTIYQYTPIIDHNYTVNFASIDPKIIAGNDWIHGVTSSGTITIPSCDAKNIIVKLRAHPDILSINNELTNAGEQFENPCKNSLLFAYSLAQRIATKQNIVAAIAIAAAGTSLYFSKRIS